MKIRDDMEELRRLGAMFNVSTHETADHGQSGTKELRLHNPDAAVFIRYVFYFEVVFMSTRCNNL